MYRILHQCDDVHWFVSYLIQWSSQLPTSKFYYFIYQQFFNWISRKFATSLDKAITWDEVPWWAVAINDQDCLMAIWIQILHHNDVHWFVWYFIHWINKHFHLFSVEFATLLHQCATGCALTHMCQDTLLSYLPASKVYISTPEKQEFFITVAPQIGTFLLPYLGHFTWSIWHVRRVK